MAANFAKEMGNIESSNQMDKEAAVDSAIKRVQGQNTKRSQPQPMINHPSFAQDMTSTDFLQNYAGLSQPSMFGYTNGTSAFTNPMIPPMLVQQPMQGQANVQGMYQTGFMYPTLSETKAAHSKASHYFPPFTKGSLIMLSSGGLKPIEDLKTADFVESAKISKQLHLETCKIAKIQDVPNSTITLIGFAVESCEKEVLVEKPSDHPFYVYEQGWASCKPDATLAQYGLPCQQLKVGDLCVFLSDKIDNWSDKVIGKSTMDDISGGKSFGEKFFTSQTADNKELSRDGPQNIINNESKVHAFDVGHRKSASIENPGKPDDAAFGQPVVKKAKLDVIEDAVKK